MIRWVVVMLCLLVQMAQADYQVSKVRSWQSPEHTRYVLDLSGPATYLISPDSTPGQVCVDLSSTTLNPDLPAEIKARGVVSHGHWSTQGDTLRISLDMKSEASPMVFELPPAGNSGYRLVIDLIDATHEETSATTSVALPTVTQTAPATVPDSAPSAPVNQEKPTHGRDMVIAIDAGHGGQDTGAIGPGKIYEKNVTLAIARSLREQMLKVPGLKPVLTRSGDYFIPLAERREIARRHYHADIFISIHADASPSADARGASVFALSLKGANTATSRFARSLAERENNADAVGGITVNEHDGTLANVLADMVVEGSLEHSLRLGRDIIGELKGFSPLHSSHVEQAGFAVLKEPGMVSLLVENGFITNPSEEKHLKNSAYQHRLAHAILEGLQRYCQHNPLPGTWFALHREDSSRVSATLDTAAR
ncbi:MAG: AMIN domain-containing protein [Pseudomonadales bacterium]|nr:AMIN domain-containing protein [Pseudomonadales bacterium]